MDVVIVIAVLALFVAVPILLWRMRRSRLARGMGASGRFYNSIFGLGAGAADTVVSDEVGNSGPPRSPR